MMRHGIVLAALLSLLCAGCLDSKEGFIHFSFTVDYDIPEQTLPGDPLLSLLPVQPLPDIPIDMNTDSQFNSQVFDHIVRIRVQGLVFTINSNSTNPLIDDKEPDPSTPDDWSFLESVEIWIEHPQTFEQGMIALVPSGDPQLLPGNTSLSFTCLNTDLEEYFDSNYNTTLILKATGTFPPDDVIFQATADFKITAALIR